MTEALDAVQDASRYYIEFDGEKRYEIIERGTDRFIACSKWARWSQSMASIFSAFPHFVDPYLEAMRLDGEARDEEMAHTSALKLRIAEETAEWRKTDDDCVFYDPFAPEPPFDMTKLREMLNSRPDDAATAGGLFF